MSQLPISAHLSEVFLKLPKGVDPIVAVFLVLSLEDGAREAASPAEEKWFAQIRAKYYLDDGEAVKKFFGNRFTHMLPDGKKSSFGKYYSPTGAIHLLRDMLDPILRPADLLLDLCVGIGAFAFEFTGNEFYGFDIDPTAIQILKKMGFKFMVEMDAAVRWSLETRRTMTGPQKTAAHQKSRFRRRWIRGSRTVIRASHSCAPTFS